MPSASPSRADHQRGLSLNFHQLTDSEKESERPKSSLRDPISDNVVEDRRKRTPFKDVCGGLDRLGYGDQPIRSNGSQGEFWSHLARPTW
jgi:hypothetical protein